MKQMKWWHVCQKCGRVADDQLAEDEGWLVWPSVKDPEIRVVRCYRHITLHSLTKAGLPRTNEWKEWAAEGKAIAESEPPGIHPVYEPFPLIDSEPGMPHGTPLDGRQGAGYGRRNRPTQEKKDDEDG